MGADPNIVGGVKNELPGNYVFHSSLWVGGSKVNHDLEDLAELLKMIEERLIVVERGLEKLADRAALADVNDGWYWLYG